MHACMHHHHIYPRDHLPGSFFCPTFAHVSGSKETASGLVELLRLVRGGLFARDGAGHEPFLSVARCSFFERRDSRKGPVGSQIRTSDCAVNAPINNADNPAEAAAGGNNNFATRTRWSRWLRGSGEFVMVVVVLVGARWRAGGILVDE
jgi:hypothetical protein